MFTFGEFRKTVHNVMKPWMLGVWIDEEFYPPEEINVFDNPIQLDDMFVKSFEQEFNWGELESQTLVLRTKNEI